MADQTGSGVIGGTNQSADNDFGDFGFWFEWIEFEGVLADDTPDNLTQAGFNVADGSLGAGQVVYNAGGTDNLDQLASNASAANLGNNAESFGLRVTTVLDVTNAGNYRFDVRSDDGVILFVDGVQVVNDDGVHAPRTRSGDIDLGPGPHEIVIIYFERTGQNVLEVDIQSDAGGDYPTEIQLQNAAVRANALADTIETDDGNDEVESGAGADSVDGGAGADTLDGGADNDTLIGGAGNDSLIGGGGDDTLDGGAGADTLLGGSGNDTLTGGTGNDSLVGGDGDDSAFGGAGDDTIDLGAGDDRFQDGTGNDLVFAGDGNDAIASNGEGGDDTLFGGEGADTLAGGAGADSVVGDAGDDALEGSDGADVVDGGAGNDYIAGFDIANLTGNAPAQNLNPPVGSDDNANDTLLGGTGDDTAFGGGGADEIDGGADDDILFGGTGTDDVEGGTGDDIIDAGADNDEVSAGTGADTIRASSGQDTIDGGAGSDTYTVPATSTLGALTETITVTVDENGDGTVAKSVDGTTDEIGSVENFIADEAGAEADTLVFTTVVANEGTISGLNGSTGVFTDKNGGITAFGGAGQPTFADVLAQDRTGSFVANGGDLDGTVGGIGFTDFETVRFDVICFAEGTRIRCKDGARQIETLHAGDRVWTKDHGYQAIRWIGRTKVLASGKLAPIRIEAGALGNHTALRVSPQHRMLVTGPAIELLFGTPEVLAAAKFLVNGRTIVEDPGGEVTYFHLLFDEHEIIDAEGAMAESLLPGATAIKTLGPAAREELKALFPELFAKTTRGQVASRSALRDYEARALATVNALDRRSW